MSVSVTTELAASTWRSLAFEHKVRADTLTARWREAHDAQRAHEIEDFLFSYYPIRPARLRHWAAGVGVLLLPEHSDPDVGAELTKRQQARWFTRVQDGVMLDIEAYNRDRGPAVKYIRALLSGTASRPANLGCFGLHEWAMVYQQDETRHALPLRLGSKETDRVVEVNKIRCTHFDAFRFFTPAARPFNRMQPTRDTQPLLEQPGCLHANMDLYKWAWKLTPAAPGDLLLDCFELARDIRYLDMQASPYDVSKFGLPPVRIETPEGKTEYSRRQGEFAERSQPLRQRLIDVCDSVLR
ncbi:3-methyladenine DNA glycosylase [Timonella sp. A28]|uniref:3-methyladenine DNA glycosylase n=1 Tax=Timonella sp. A28 TaxID=3442640 RepID=UPI003EB99008